MNKMKDSAHSPNSYWVSWNWLLSLALLLLAANFCTAQSNQQQAEFQEAVQTPEKAKSLTLPCSPENIASFVKQVKKFNKLEKLVILGKVSDEQMASITHELQFLPRLTSLSFENNGIQAIPPGLEALTTLARLEVHGNVDLNYTKLLHDLRNNERLGILHLDNNNLTHLPPNLKKFDRLERVYITQNDNLDLVQSVKQLKKVDKLIELALPVNRITDLPQNIGKLDQLKMLDLRGNYISELPEEMADMDQLVSLNIQGNPILDPLREMKKLQKLDIRYLSLDEGLTAEDIQTLRELFPNINLDEVEELDAEEGLDELEDGLEAAVETPDTGTIGALEEAFLAENGLREDSLDRLASVDPPAPSDTKPTSIDLPELSPDADPNTGFIKIGKPAFKALSPAYLYYPDFFGVFDIQAPLDTTPFLQRYLDTNYVYTRPRNPNIVNNLFRLTLVKKKQRGEIWFNFYREPRHSWLIFSRAWRPYNRYLVQTYPELSAFAGTNFEYNGDLNKREFKKTYLKEGFFKKKHYTDFRIYYRPDDEIFTLELKDEHGFRQLQFHARHKNPKVTLERAMKDYEGRYIRYTNRMLRKESRFQRSLVRRQRQWEKMRRKQYEAAWANLARYMTKEEKQMTRQEWLAYYDQIIADEQYALANAMASTDLLVRSLQADGYILHGIGAPPFTCGNMNTVSADFQNHELDKLPVRFVLVVDKANKRIFRSIGSLGVNPTNLSYCVNGSNVILVQLRNGDFGVVKENYFASNAVDNLAWHAFTVDLFDGKLTTVGHLREYLGLE